MFTELDRISNIIHKHSAIAYAANRMEDERKEYKLHVFNSKTGQTKETKPSYKFYMTNYWGCKGKDSLEQCIEASHMSKLNEYAHMVQMYTGWVQNGRLFVLHKQEKFVSFLYKIEKNGWTLDAPPQFMVCKTHYNPLNVDCVEDNISAKSFGNGADYLISINEIELMEQCDFLIKYQNKHKK